MPIHKLAKVVLGLRHVPHGRDEQHGLQHTLLAASLALAKILDQLSAATKTYKLIVRSIKARGR